MFTVKKFEKKSGQWFAVSLINEKGSFRGAAKFETESEAQKYLEDYKERIRRPVELKVFAE
jgi:hypothetical protein